MSDSDSSIPQKVVALAGALEAVCQYVGSEYERPGRFYCNFLSYLNALGPNPDPWDGTPEEARERFLAIAAKFVEAVDTAERQLNATPVSDLEPLSSFTGGVRWDVRTRRTLKEIQASISILHYGSTKPDFMLTLLEIGRDTRTKEMQHELNKFFNELRERIFDLQCLPDEPTDPTNAIPGQRRVLQEPVVNPNETTQSDGSSVLPSSKREDPTEKDDKLPEKLRKDSPSRVKAKAAYDYAMQQIPNANKMTAVELFDAICDEGEAKEMLPPSAESFTKYLNDCGVRLRKSDTKPTSRSVVRRSDT
jgi:hypothetical protein